MRRTLAVLAVLLAIWWIWLRETPVPPPPAGVAIAEEPDQRMLDASEVREWDDQGWRVRALADYTLRARVLSRARYRFDATAAIAPLDLALGWGPMSDTGVLDYVTVSQDGRWYDYYVRPGCPASLGDIASHSANVHCLPASDEVWAALQELKVNDVARLTGCLVEATPPGGGPPWRSSLSRTDTGNGACEIFRITSVVREPRRD